jgi:hypothetical protein
MGIGRTDRGYIERFSKAYKILYKEDNTVYLPEIFDSAQEGYSYLWVNGEKYVFSEDVLSSGKELRDAFYNLNEDLLAFDDFFRNKITSNELFREIKQDLNSFLENFDRLWARYEKNYILELMVIESDSRRFIQDAINAENDLALIESEKLDRSRSPNKNRKAKIKQAKSELIIAICKINSVANTNGKGRDDLTYEILE